MEIKFAKWGNSIGLRVPSEVAEALGITPGCVADVRMKHDRLIITPRPTAYRLDDLLADITPENVHREIQTGIAIGAEGANS